MIKQFFWSLLFLISKSALATILIIDYGSPITPYIKYHLQCAHIKCVEYDHTITAKDVMLLNPTGIILSGSPAPVCKPGSPQALPILFELGVPILGICYGQQLLAVALGGTVEHNAHPEQGPTPLMITDTCLLTKNIWHSGDVVEIWMGHEDRIVNVPQGFKTIAHTAGSPHAMIADDVRKFYGVQFHPEAPKSSCPELIVQFAISVVGEKRDPSVAIEPLSVDERALYRSLNFGCCQGLSK